MGPRTTEHDKGTGPMLAVTKGLATKADKIRALGDAGYGRRQIANFLGLSYQRVRNVLAQPDPRAPAANAGRKRPRTSLKDNETPPYEPLALTAEVGRVALDEQGRIQLSPRMLAELAMKPGDSVPFSIEKGEVRLFSIPALLRDVRANLGPAIDGPGIWSEELVAERRAEAAKEEEESREWLARDGNRSR